MLPSATRTVGDERRGRQSPKPCLLRSNDGYQARLRAGVAGGSVLDLVGVDDAGLYLVGS